MFNTGDLTVVILSYSRQEFLLRNMKFWSSYEAVRVIALDGSDTPITDYFLNQLTNNINYYHKPCSFGQRLRFASENITTKYVILMCDDEFYIPSVLSSCISFLEKNLDYVSCGGRVMAFDYDGSRVNGWSIYDEMIDRQILLNDPAERLDYHCRNYTPNAFYSVTRSDSWKKAFQAHIDNQINFYASGEMQFQMTIATLGKVKTLNELLWLRSFEAKRIFNTDPGLTNSVFFQDWWERSPKNNEYIENTIKYMPIEKNQLIFSVENYLYRRKKTINLVNKIKSFLIRFVLPPVIYEKLRMNFGQRLPDLLSCANFYISKNIMVDIKALKEIKANIELFHATKKRKYGE